MITIKAVNPLGAARYYKADNMNAAYELMAALKQVGWTANLV